MNVKSRRGGEITVGKLLKYAALLLAAVLLIVGAYYGFMRNEPLPQDGSSAGFGLMLLERDAGLYVLAVTQDSPADRAEIHPGDYLLRAGEERLHTTAQLDALIDGAGDVLRLVLLREEQELTVQLSTR